MLVLEPRTSDVLAWLERMEPGAGFISDWTHVEVRSALSIKVRTRQIELSTRAAAGAAWQELAATSFPTLAVTPRHFLTAATLVERVELGLRSGDALHLAIAREGGHEILTLDRGLAEAALQLGVPVTGI